MTEPYEVVEQNRLFTSDRPGLGQELETLQQHEAKLEAIHKFHDK